MAKSGNYLDGDKPDNSYEALAGVIESRNGSTCRLNTNPTHLLVWSGTY